MNIRWPLPVALLLAAVAACSEQGPDYVLSPAAPLADAVHGAIPAPMNLAARGTAEGRVEIYWEWSHEGVTWGLVSFTVLIDGEEVDLPDEDIYTLKPYEGGSFKWGFTTFGGTYDPGTHDVCVEVMAKDFSGDRKPTLTFHADACTTVEVPEPWPSFTSFPNDDRLIFTQTPSSASPYVQDGKLFLCMKGSVDCANAAWFDEKVRLADGFFLEIWYGLHPGAEVGADGIAFVIYGGDTPPIGAPGNGLGYHGIPQSLAFEVDTFDPITWQNIGEFALHSCGTAPNSTGPECELWSLDEPSDAHYWFPYGQIRLWWDPGATVIDLVIADDVSYDRMSLGNVDMADILDADGKAWVGITSGTGMLSQNHVIFEWTMSKP